MPVQGYKTITVSVDVYTKLNAYATKTNRTTPRAIEHLVKNAAPSMHNYLAVDSSILIFYDRKGKLNDFLQQKKKENYTA